VHETSSPSRIHLELDGPIDGSRLGDHKQTAEFVAKLARDTNAECCFVYNHSGYFKRMAFKDRPGVGWMLYLPREYTQADVPEARALIPLTKEQPQMGTIIVCFTDGALTTEGPSIWKSHALSKPAWSATTGCRPGRQWCGPRRNRETTR
jgi:Immunity protein 52